VHHKGYVNGTAALDRRAATFPGAAEIVVVGESAGHMIGWRGGSCDHEPLGASG
jgi:hypothetical protein